ncbi:MAG: hypothetical protein ACKOCK_06870 [Chloroflexota bacterium]
MTENERRASDTLRPRDLVVRAASVVALFAIMLFVVLSISPI